MALLKRLFLSRWLWNLVLVVVPLGGLALGFFLMQLSLGLPDVAGLKSFSGSHTTRVLARDGQVVATLFREKRSPVALARVSPWLIKALLAVEDSRFFDHGGVDWWGVGRAFFANTLLGRVDQGASTLTMQLARNRFLNQDLSYRRKIREMMLARQIEQQFSKQQILELYLNNVYFGSGAYGVASASRLYFQKDPSDLSLAQAALIAGLVQAPSRLSPLVDAPAALARMKTVLGRMHAGGVITAEEYQHAAAQTFRFRRQAAAAEPLLKHPYFTTYVIAQLSRDYSQEDLFRGGLAVSTTLDVGLQKVAEQELSALLAESGAGVNADSAALVLLENSTGAVRAMVGGRGWHKKNQFNRAWQALRQPGSSFKPFVYAAALQAGMTPDSLVDDLPVTFGNWTPRNSDGGFRGRIPLRQALRESRNVVSARLCNQVGPLKVVELARALGIQEKLQAHLSIALGSCEVSPLSMASAYATIASGGIYHQPIAITQVKGQGGLRDYREALLAMPVLTPEVASQMLEMMMGVVQSGTGTAAQIYGVDVAGKTGTTDGSRDAWFVGSTPDYTLAVWVGNDDHSPMWEVYGGGLPARLWQRVMSRVPQARAHFGMTRTLVRRAAEPVVEALPEAQERPAAEPEVEEEEPLPPVIPWESPQPEVTPAPEVTATPAPVDETPLPQEEPI